MLRAAMAVVIGGYAFGGIGTGTGQQPASDTVSHAASQAPATKTVQFRGYELSVPAGWPVYRLDTDPRRCVRYDVHAVYLGAPGTDQNCPAGIVGRTETVSVGAPPDGARPPVISQRSVVNGQSAAPGRVGPPGVILQDTSVQELGIAMPSSAPAITATYGSDPATIEQVLASVHRIVPQKARMATPVPNPNALAKPSPSVKPSASAKPSPSAKQSPSARPSRSARLVAIASPSPAAKPPAPPRPSARPSPAPRPTSASAVGAVNPSPTTSPTGLPTGPPVTAATPPPPRISPTLAVSKGAQAGFDTCTAPSLPTMKAWRARYSATAIYIGGSEMACGYGNLNAAWVHSVEAQGWSLLPTYVGPQAPCDTFSGKVSTNPKRAAQQGKQNAQWAVQDAVNFGLGAGSPIYYDMEAYDNTRPRCVTGVLSFLDAWTRQLNAEGYISGVYSSADSAVIDLAKHAKVTGHQLAEPQAIWFALWDNASDLNGTPYLPSGMWTGLHRSKQFAGSHWVKIRRIAMDIDSDLVNSAVAR